MLVCANNDFRKLYPGLPGKALKFFRYTDPAKEGGEDNKTVLSFLLSLNVPDTEGDGSRFPGILPVLEILERLTAMGYLFKIFSGTTGGLQDKYMFIQSEEFINQISEALEYKLFGFEAIYDDFKQSVLPVIYKDDSGNESIGSSFIIGSNTIITAAHCIKGASSLSIKGVSFTQFAEAKIYLSKNEALDLALIKFSEPILTELRPIFFNTGKVLDDVLAFGYPNVPGFTELLAVEKATISSRITATKGIIASAPTEIFAQTELFLITAKVRGGFSGGPVMDEWGRAIGLVSRQPISQNTDDRALWDKYDNLGYGVVIPFEEINKLIIVSAKNDTRYFGEINNRSLSYKEI